VRELDDATRVAAIPAQAFLGFDENLEGLKAGCAGLTAQTAELSSGDTNLVCHDLQPECLEAVASAAAWSPVKPELRTTRKIAARGMLQWRVALLNKSVMKEGSFNSQVISWLGVRWNS